jgi:hypothetical protein
MSYTTIAWIILIGCLLFLFAAFNPASMAFGAPTPEAKLEIIRRYERLWVISQYAFGLGAVVAAAGYLLLARAGGPQAAYGGLLTLVSSGMLAGALLWGINLFMRATDFEGFANGTQPNWPFLTYTLLTLLGLAVWGYVFLQGGFPVWLGWGTLAPAVVLFALLVIFKDMPPFVYYLISLELVWVLFKQPPS